MSSRDLIVRSPAHNPLASIITKSSNDNSVYTKRSVVGQAASASAKKQAETAGKNGSKLNKPTPGANVTVQIVEYADFTKVSKFNKSYTEGNIKLGGRLLRTTKGARTSTGLTLVKPGVIQLTVAASIWYHPAVLRDPNVCDAQYIMSYLDIQRRAQLKAKKTGSLTPEEEAQLTHPWPILEQANLSEYAKKTFLPKCTPTNTPPYAPNSQSATSNSGSGSAASGNSSGAGGNAAAANGYVPPITDMSKLTERVTKSLQKRHVADYVCLLLYTYAGALSGELSANGEFIPKGQRAIVNGVLKFPVLTQIDFAHPKPGPDQTTIKNNSIVELIGLEYKITIDPLKLKVDMENDNRMSMGFTTRFSVMAYKKRMDIESDVLLHMRIAKGDYARTLVPSEIILAKYRQDHPLDIGTENAVELEATVPSGGAAAASTDESATSAASTAAPKPAKKSDKFVLPYSMFYVPAKTVPEYYVEHSVSATSLAVKLADDSGSGGVKKNPWLIQDITTDAPIGIKAEMVLQAEQWPKPIVENLNKPLDPLDASQPEMDAEDAVTSGFNYRVWIGRMAKMSGTVDIYYDKGLDKFPIDKNDYVTWVNLAPIFMQNIAGILDVKIDPNATDTILYNANQVGQDLTPEEATFKAKQCKVDQETGDEYIDVTKPEEMAMAIAIAKVAPVTIAYGCRATALLFDQSGFIKSCGVNVSYEVAKTFLSKHSRSRPVCSPVPQKSSTGAINMSCKEPPTLSSPENFAYYLVYLKIEEEETMRIMQTITPADSDFLYGEFLNTKKYGAALEKAGLSEDFATVVNTLRSSEAYVFAVPLNTEEIIDKAYKQLVAEFPDLPKEVSSAASTALPAIEAGSNSTASVTANTVVEANPERKQASIEEIPDETPSGKAPDLMVHATNDSKRKRDSLESGQDAELKPPTPKKSKLLFEDVDGEEEDVGVTLPVSVNANDD